MCQQESMALCMTPGNPACLLWWLWRGAKPPEELLIDPAGYQDPCEKLPPWLFAPQVGFAELGALSVSQCEGGLEETLWLFSNSWILLLFVRIHLYVSADISYLCVSLLLVGWFGLFPTNVFAWLREIFNIHDFLVITVWAWPPVCIL